MVYTNMTGASVLGANSFCPDLGGQAVFTLAGTEGATATWDGKSSQGQLVQGGVYTVVLVENPENSPGNPAFSVTLTVDVLRTQQADSGVAIYNSAGELVRHITRVPGSAQFLKVSPSSFVEGKQGAGARISWGPSEIDSAGWDGSNDAGALVGPGLYEVTIVTEVAGQPASKHTAFVQVIGQTGGLLDGAAAVPNPVPSGDSTLLLSIPNAAATDSVQVRLYTLAGGLVVQTSGGGPQILLDLPPGLSGGVYLVALQDYSPTQGLSQRSMLKIAILR